MTGKLHRAWQHALNSQVVTGKESDETVRHVTQVTETRNAHKVFSRNEEREETTQDT